jgi:short-subunit dehydrogenase
LCHSETREAAFERTLRALGRIDLLINNAGVGLYALPTETPFDGCRRVFEVNVLAPMALAQLVLPSMSRQGSGIIVNIGSVAGLVALPWAAAYCASKSALHAMHDALRRELRGTPVRIIKVCPGIVDTDFRTHALAGAAPPAVLEIRRVVTAETVAAKILQAVKRGRNATVYIPRIGALFGLAGALAPALMDRYLARFLAAERRRNGSLGLSQGSGEPS